MKLTKTKRALLIVTMLMLVLTLGLGLVFMHREQASADEPAPELIPLADAELQQTQAIKAGAGGVWWDATQMRLYFKVTGVASPQLTNSGSGFYNASDKLFFTIGGEEKPVSELNWGSKGWIDNTSGHNSDATVDEIWISTQDTAYLKSITEVKIAEGFSLKDGSGADTNIKTKKDYYLWNGDTLGWLTRADKEKGITVNYTGETTIAWGGTIDESKLEVKATPKGSEEAVKIDQGCYTISDFNPYKAGQQTVKVKYQDLEEKTFTVTVQEDANADKGLKITGIDTRKTTADASAAWLRIDVGFDEETAAGFTRDKNLIHIEMAKNVNFADFIEVDGKKLSDPSLVNATNLQWAASQEGGNLIFGFASAELAAAVKQVKLCAGLQWITCDAAVEWPHEEQIPNYKAVPGATLKQDVILYNAHDAGWQRAAKEITATLTDGTESLSAEVGQQLSAEELAKLNITAKFLDGSADAKIDTSKVSIELPSTAGAGQATVTYQGKTATFAVNMTASKTLQSIEVKSTNYSAQRWTRPDFSDLQVVAHFADEEDEGTTLSAGEFTVSGYDMWTTETTTEATVSYSYAGGEAKTAAFTINVTDYTGSTFMKIGTDALLNFEWGGYSFIQFGSVRFEGFTSYSPAGLVTAPFNQDKNIMYADLTAGAHVGDYIELTISGTTKTVTEWIAQADSGVLGVVTFNSGNWMIQVTGTFNKSTVTLVTFKAGLEWITSDLVPGPAFPCTKEKAPASQYHTVPGAVLTKDVVLYNSGTTWVKAVKELTASYTGTVLQNGSLDKDNLTVNATYYGEEQATKLGNNDYEVEFSSATVGDAIEGTVTYRGKTATFTVKVEAPTKTLDRIEVSGTTTFEGKRFGTAPALTGLVVTAYFEGEEEGTVLQAGENGYTVGALDMWDTEGDHKIQISYLYGTTTKTAEITLKITAPDTSIYFDFAEGGSNNGYMNETEWGKPGEGKGSTRFEWTYAGANRYCLSFQINVVGVDGYVKDTNGINFERVTGIHLGEYVKFTYDGQVKTLAELLEDQVVKTVGISDGGNLIIWFLAADSYTKVTDVTFLTGMQLPKITNAGIAWETGANDQQVNDSIELVPGLVLQHDVCLWNADAAGWQKRADSITVALKDGATVTVGDDIKTKIDVKAVFGSEQQAITAYTVTGYTATTAGQQTITVTYQDRTATLQITVAEQQTPPPAEEKVTVTFNTQEGSTVEAQEIDKGGKATKPATDPTREGYTFKGWYTTADGDTEFDFTQAVNADTTVYAQWTKNEPAPGPGGEEQPGGGGGEEQPGGGSEEQPGGGSGEQPGETPSEGEEEDDGCGGAIETSALVIILAVVALAATVIVFATRKKRN